MTLPGWVIAVPLLAAKCSHIYACGCQKERLMSHWRDESLAYRHSPKSDMSCYCNASGLGSARGLHGLDLSGDSFPGTDSFVYRIKDNFDSIDVGHLEDLKE